MNKILPNSENRYHNNLKNRLQSHLNFKKMGNQLQSNNLKKN